MSGSRDDSGDPPWRSLCPSNYGSTTGSRHESPPSYPRSDGSPESGQTAVGDGLRPSMRTEPEEKSAMRNGVKHAAMGEAVRLAAWVLVFGLSTALPGRSLGQQPAGNTGVGQRIVPKQRNLTLQNGGGAPSRAIKPDIYRVEQVNRGWLLLRPPADPPAGWGPIRWCPSRRPSRSSATRSARTRAIPTTTPCGPRPAGRARRSPARPGRL